MLTQNTLEKCREIGQWINFPMVWLRLGFACGKVSRALPTVEPGVDLLERVAEFKGSLDEVEVIIDEWIEVHDRMRRTRLRSISQFRTGRN